MSRSSIFWLIAYLCTLALVVGAMFSARSRALATFGSAAARQQWQEDRDELRERSAGGPVKRRVTPLDEPPALVLMRDYFWRTLALTLVLASALFFVFMIALRGAFGATPPARHEGNGRPGG